MKLLQFADLHIREKDIEEISRCLDFIIETARREKPDLIVNAGDTFDSADVKMGSRSALQAIAFHAALADIAPVVVIKGTPSHDGNSPEILRYVCGFNGIIVADRPMQIGLQDESLYTLDAPELSHAPDAIITLIPTPTKQFFQTTAGIEGSDQEIGKAMSALFAGFGATAAEYPGVPHILVTHLNVNGCRLANGQIRTGMDIEVSVDQMNLGNFDLGCLGHIHASQALGEKYFYSGPVYSTKIGEEGPMGFWIHSMRDEEKMLGFTHRFIETPCKRTVRFKRDLTEDEPEPVYVDGVAGAHVRYELTTWQDWAGEIDKAGIEKMLLEAGALSVDIRINAIPRETIRAAAVLEAETLRDEFSEMAKLRGEDLDPEILAMAEKLESVPGEEILKEVAA